VIAAVVLAAGAATRFGSPKQRVLLPHVLEALARSSVDDVVVVTGAHSVETDARVVHCPEWERGPGASLRWGLVAVSHKVEAAVVVLADGPTLDARAVDRVIAAWRDGAGDRLAATYDGTNRSHPVLLAREAWSHIPYEGARGMAVTLVPCDDLTEPGDVDTPIEGWTHGDGESPT
jgi:nicotine blue oxidoreductase